ncbi:MAG: H-NS histone family protein [Xylophilus ampelinus]
MAKSYKDLVAERDEINRKIEELRNRDVGEAVERIQGLIQEFGLTEEDVFPPSKERKTSAHKGKKVAAKYRDPESGKEWTGRGKAPRWFNKEEADKFLI